MATKLRNLSVKKVDFVDEGANQQADIKLLLQKWQDSTKKLWEKSLKMLT